MNQALHFYSEDDSVFVFWIYNGFKSLKKHNEDFISGKEHHLGGGEPGKNWQSVDWKVNNYNNFKHSIKQKMLSIN